MSAGHDRNSLTRICKERGVNPSEVKQIACLGCGITEQVDGVPMLFGHFFDCEGDNDNLRFRTAESGPGKSTTSSPSSHLRAKLKRGLQLLNGRDSRTN